MGKKIKHTVIINDSIKLDAIGHWSEAKLEILGKYAEPYSALVKRYRLHAAYIDAFSGTGLHSKKVGTGLVKGSPRRALDIPIPFDEYHFIEWNTKKAKYLKETTASNQSVHVYEGDCNKVLMTDVFPKIRYENYERAFCFLDPYGLHLDWSVFVAAGKSRAIEVMVNFTIMDINMNVVRSHSDKIAPEHAARMDRYWGDDSWREALYAPAGDLFDADHDHRVAKAQDVLPKLFGERLIEVAGFQYVADPLPMTDDDDRVLYFLLFASPNKTGKKIMNQIFAKYRK